MNRNITTTLKELVELQEADSRLFELLKLRGSLPAEVEALKKHIEQLYADISAKEAFLVALQESQIDLLVAFSVAGSVPRPSPARILR